MGRVTEDLEQGHTEPESNTEVINNNTIILLDKYPVLWYNNVLVQILVKEAHNEDD